MVDDQPNNIIRANKKTLTVPSLKKLQYCNDVRTMFACFQIIHVRSLKWLIKSASQLVSFAIISFIKRLTINSFIKLLS